jgi:hypothetical protein
VSFHWALYALGYHVVVMSRDSCFPYFFKFNLFRFSRKIKQKFAKSLKIITKDKTSKMQFRSIQFLKQRMTRYCFKTSSFDQFFCKNTEIFH